MRINRSLIAASVLALGTFMTGVGLRAQGNSGNGPDGPPDGRGDVIRGAMPHGGAPPSRGSGSGANGINYHNGPVLHKSPINLYFILYGNWGQAALNPTGTTFLTQWAQSIGGSPYFNINSTYTDSSGSVPNAVTFVGTYTDTANAFATSLSDANVATLVMNGIGSGFVPPGGGAPVGGGAADPNGLYMVLTAPGVKEASGFITQYCGWHWWGSIVNGAITAGKITAGSPYAQYAFIGNAAGPSLGNCNGQTQNISSPNGDPGVDAMISVMAHELSETATDPLGTAWYDSGGNENGDKCAWNFGTTYSALNGSLANVSLDGTSYLMQQIWLNASGGKCALSYFSPNSSSYNVSSSGSQTVVQGGASNPYALTATPVGSFSGPVTWTVTTPPGSGITASSPASITSSSVTLTADPATPLGTYYIDIVGASTGTTPPATQPTSTTLVVSAPTFSLSTESLNPQSVTRPSSGTTTVLYTIDVNQIGKFTDSVGLTVTGGTTGVSPSFPPGTAVVPPGKATLSVVVSSNARRGTRTFTVTGTDSITKKTATTTATLTIN